MLLGLFCFLCVLFFCGGENCFYSRLSLGCGGGFFFFWFLSLCWFLGNKTFSSRPILTFTPVPSYTDGTESNKTLSSSFSPVGEHDRCSSLKTGGYDVCWRSVSKSIDGFDRLLESVSRLTDWAAVSLFHLQHWRTAPQCLYWETCSSCSQTTSKFSFNSNLLLSPAS